MVRSILEKKFYKKLILQMVKKTKMLLITSTELSTLLVRLSKGG